MYSFKEVQTSMKQKVTGKMITFKFMYTKRIKIKTDNLQRNSESEMNESAN